MGEGQQGSAQGSARSLRGYARVSKGIVARVREGLLGPYEGAQGSARAHLCVTYAAVGVRTDFGAFCASSQDDAERCRSKFRQI